MPQTLFDPLPPAAARTDPRTSHIAAAEITASGQRGTDTRYAAGLVALSPGLTSLELARRHSLCRYKLGKRLPDAMRLGMVRQGEARTCSVSGRLAVTWFPVEAGA